MSSERLEAIMEVQRQAKLLTGAATVLLMVKTYNATLHEAIPASMQALLDRMSVIQCGRPDKKEEK